ncbi:MAG: hypothetical protein CW691_01500, partial [Candidatus Bathyarchaeum sp.]
MIRPFISKNYRILGIVTIVLVYVTVSVITFYSICGTYVEITNPPPQVLAIPFNINLKGETGFVQTDVSIGLNCTSTKGVLVVNEPIEIRGITALLEDEANNISRISLTFENCLEYPLNFSQWNMPEQGFIHFLNEPPFNAGMGIDKTTGKILMYMISETTVTWTSEGAHKPIIGIFFKDGTNRTMTQESSPINIYPRSNLTEVQSATVNVQLAFAVFFFTAFTVIGVILDIWRSKDTEKEELKKAIL